MHSIDRSVISVVAEPLKHEFELSDRSIGFLGGVAHAAGYVLTVLPLGMLADRINRTRLLGSLVTIWSGLTMLSGFAGSFVAVALCRFGVGAAEAGGMSSSLSLITDYFPKRERGMAISIFFMSTALGTGLIFLFGGLIVSLYGWREAFYAAGIPGIIFGILAWLTLREPLRGGDEEAEAREKAPPFGAVLRYIAATPPLWLSILGLTLAVIVVAGLWAWAVSFFIRVHGLPISQAGLILAIALGLIQGVCLPLFGWLNDRLGRGRPDRIHLISIFGMLASVPVGGMMVLAPSATMAILCAMVLGMTTAAWIGQTYGAVAVLAPPAMRGSVVSVGQLGTNLIGTGCGPLLIGLLSDLYGGDGSMLRYAMATVLSLFIASALCLLLAMRLVPVEARAVSSA